MRKAGKWLVTGVLYLWGGIWGLLLVVILTIATVFFPFGSYEKLIQYGTRTFLFLIGIRLRVQGPIPPPDSPVIYMGNHVNMFDIFVLGAAIPGFKRGVEAAEHFRWPVWGFMVRRVGNIPIQRGNLERAKASLSAAADAVNRGVSIVILPEGHRTRNGGLQPLKKGPFHMAKAAGVSVVPVGLNGMWEIKRYGDPHWRPGEVTVRFGRPISPVQIQHSSVDEIRRKTRETLLTLIDYDENHRLETGGENTGAMESASGGTEKPRSTRPNDE